MPRSVLAIETSGELCSVAFRDASGLREDTRHLKRSHNEALLKMLDELIAPGERLAVDEVVFGAGPGSFTGVRIGAAAAQALALAADAPMRAIDSLTAIAYASRMDTEDYCLIARYSRRDALYLGGFTHSQCDFPTPTLRPRLITSAAELELALNECPVHLTASPLIGDELPAAWARPLELTWRPALPVTGATLVALADRGAAPLVAPERALPSYVAGDHPWVKQV